MVLRLLHMSEQMPCMICIHVNLSSREGFPNTPIQRIILYPCPTWVRFQSSFSNRTPYSYIGIPFQTLNVFARKRSFMSYNFFNGISKFSFMQSRLKSLVEAR